MAQQGSGFYNSPENEVHGLHGSIREEDGMHETLQEEFNEIIEAFYEVVGEDGLRKYQADAESMSDRRIAEDALNVPHSAPDFELEDQDGEKYRLSTLLEKGPVVIQFYRGAWCPLCNASIRRMQREGLPAIVAKGASFVAISPMLPDGTQYLSTKHDLKFPICSDLQNEVAKKFNITFTIESDFIKEVECSEMPKWNGDDSYEVPLPATYVIAQNGDIVWSFVENDITMVAEMREIIAAIPTKEEEEEKEEPVKSGVSKPKRVSAIAKKKATTTFMKMKDVKSKFGKKKQSGADYLGSFLLKAEY